MTSKKQITANKKNSKKAGVKTAKGKAISKFNALKHGLLAKEIIIDAGDGKENRNEFDSLMDGLIDHFKPMGTIEEILVESTKYPLLINSWISLISKLLLIIIALSIIPLKYVS